MALTSFRRAIRAHRKLARLAPEFFDSITIERKRRENEAQRSWMALWEPALNKVYGNEPKIPDPAAAMPQLPSPRTQQAVEPELESLKFWLSTGGMALERHQLRHPHALVDLSQLTRLLETALDLGRLACSFDSSLANPEPVNHDAASTDLKRAYGHRCNSASPDPGSPPTLAPQESNPNSNSAPAEASGGPSFAESDPAGDNSGSPPDDFVQSPAESSKHRCDAWGRWARQMRQRKGG